MDTGHKAAMWHVMIAAAALLATMLSCGECGEPVTPVPSDSGGAGVPPAAERSLFDIQRQAPAVMAGSQQPPPELRDDAFHALMIGDWVTTDKSGEALLQSQVVGSTCKVYVFQRTGLQKRACPKSANSGGNTVCQEEGAAVYRNCSDALAYVETPSAQFRFTGSWVAVIYLPEQRQSVVLVFEGQVEARPVIGFDDRTLGDPDSVPTGYFWFSDPGAAGSPVSDLEARVPHPMDELPPVINTLDLGQWINRTRAHAEEDDVPFPGWTACAPGVVYCEDFEDGEAQGWELGPGWEVQQEGTNTVLALAGKDAAIYRGGETRQDDRLSFRFRLVKEHIGALYRNLDDKGFYWILFAEGGVMLTKVTEGKWEILLSTEVPVALDRWHDASISGWGGRIQVSLDGKVVLDYLDPKPLEHGTIGFAPLSLFADIESVALLDDIEVMPAEPEPSQPLPSTERPELVVEAVKIASWSPTHSVICPATFEASADIYTNGAEGPVTYYWEYNDGYTTDKEVISFKGEGVQSVSTQRAFGSSSGGWVRLQIAEPDGSQYDQTDFKISCEPPKLTVEAVKIASWSPTHSVICPATFEASADIYTNGAEGPVTYYWEYNDGYTTDKETITFRGEGVRSVSTQRGFGSSSGGWVRLQIAEPDGSQYDQTDFKISCEPPKLTVEAVEIVDWSPTSNVICPRTFQVSADIYTNGAEGPVTYYWEYSDGYATDKEVIAFKGEGVQRVYAKRDFDSSFSGWVQLQVVEPGWIASEQVPINAPCEPPKPTAPPATALPPPPAPALSSPPDGFYAGENPKPITVRWKAAGSSSAIKSYTVQVQWGEWPSYVWHSHSALTVPGSTLSAVVQPLPSPSFYRVRWRVRAVNSQGTAGPWSPWWTFEFTLG